MKKYSAELIGTLALVLVGCGSAVIAGNHIGFVGIAFAFGLTVLAMVYAIGTSQDAISIRQSPSPCW
jgi:aquaporin Z